MPKVDVFDINGKVIGDIELNENIFGVDINKGAVHQVVVNQLANKRQGTQSAKTRSEVRGGGIKPWRQKGTGRARQGSIRAPQWIKGGVVFAPKPRDYSYTLPKKLRRLALKSVLTSKVADNKIIVLDSLNLDSIKTKHMAEILKNLKVDESAVIVIPEKNENIEKSSRNIPGVKTLLVNTINVYDIVKHNSFIVTREAVSKIEEVYA
jgi:large subunit ribosomal protein L4